MPHAELIRKLSAAGLAEVADDLAKVAQPAIHIAARPIDEAQLAPGASKLGGLPDLPHGSAWPLWHDAPLAFVGQVRMADVRKLPAAQHLPPTGRLLFFYDSRQQAYGASPDDRGAWQVIHDHSDPASLLRAPAPDALPSEARYHACALTFSDELSLPPGEALPLLGLSLSGQLQQRYEEWLAGAPLAADTSAPRHRLLGYPDQIQDEMQTQAALVSRGIVKADDPHAAAARHTASDWQLLLQVDSDEQIGMRWGSAGMLYYWILRPDLQADRFDRTWLILQSD